MSKRGRARKAGGDFVVCMTGGGADDVWVGTYAAFEENNDLARELCKQVARLSPGESVIETYEGEEGVTVTRVEQLISPTVE